MSIYFLGRKYRLKIITSNKEGVNRKGRYLQVLTMQKRNKAKIERLLDNWYRGQAMQIFRERMDRYAYLLSREKIRPKKLIVRSMKKRWGSCTPQKNIVLNSSLVKAPVQCIDYVIVHEWCHLKHFNHSKQFFALLDRYLPDWPKRKERLESIFI